MTLGGRPKDGPGHRAFNLSLREDLYAMLEKVEPTHRSNFIEQHVGPVLEQLDPGPACGLLREIDERATERLLRAHSEGDYAEAMTIEAIMLRLQDYRALCCESGDDKKRCEDIGGKWKDGACTLTSYESQKYLPNL